MKFEFLGTEIYVSFLFCAVICLMLAVDRTGLVIPTLFAVFIHESGHLFAMWATDCQPKAIRLIPSSVQIVRGFSPKNYGETVITLCGPLANVAVFSALFINYLCFKKQISLEFAILNLVLAIFNMLPLCGLDGGTLLAAALSKNGDIYKAERTVRLITGVFSILIFSAGVYLWISGTVNLSVFIVAVYLAICCLAKK